MDEKKKQFIKELFKIETEPQEVTNSEIFSLKEWLSYSKERQDSVKIFVTMAVTNEISTETIDLMDNETKQYMAKMGFMKVMLD